MITVTDNGCRNCNHIHWMIIDTLGNTSSIGGCTAPACKCSKDTFAPDDNLEYLEWMNEKRSLNK